MEKIIQKLTETSRRIAAEGSVLVKNIDNVLPIKEDDEVSFFGRTQIDYNRSGTGSGGCVNKETSYNIIDAVLKNTHIKVNQELIDVYKVWLKDHPFDEGQGWATEPWFQEEYVVPEDIVKAAREKSNKAIVVIGRLAGEDKDNAAEKGSWYLTDDEEALLDVVTKYFDDVAVLLNTGNIVDMSRVEKYNVKSIMYIWQGGQEGGNAVADVISGKVSPSGRLTDTVAFDINDYPSTKNFGGERGNLYQEDIYVGYRYFETFAPEKVMYPFGYGLSYTEFETKLTSVTKNDDKILINAVVKNIGDVPGKEVVQVYAAAPQGKLGKASRVLCGFAKTKTLAPGESEEVQITVNMYDLASYDDGGITGNKSCYVLEGGKYEIYMGKNVRDAKAIYDFNIESLIVLEKLSEVLAPEKEFDILCPDENLNVSHRKASVRTVDYDKRVADNMPKDIDFTDDKGIKLIDVKNKKYTMEEFIAQLTDDDLKYLSIGEGMSSYKARPGSASVFGGVTTKLEEMGICISNMHDGPSGIQLPANETSFSMPIATAIASAWDEEGAEELYKGVGEQLTALKIDSLLGPSINIHRSPLNGRNFEYLSEDPYLAGRIAVALVNGINKQGNSATIKHFAANSQEFNRRHADSVVSERALREIYLKPFEFCVKETNLKSLMTSYNPINGRWTALSYEIATTVLREEWGYKGIVVTDWWPEVNKSVHEIKNVRDVIISQNDLYMVVPQVITNVNNVDESLKNGSLTRGQMQRNAMNVLNYIMETKSFERFIESGSVVRNSLVDKADSLETVFEYEEPKSEETFDVDFCGTGFRLLQIEYSSETPDIGQFQVDISVNGNTMAGIRINGTSGRHVIRYMDIKSDKAEGNIKITYPGSMHIHKILVKK